MMRAILTLLTASVVGDVQLLVASFVGPQLHAVHHDATHVFRTIDAAEILGQRVLIPLSLSNTDYCVA